MRYALLDKLYQVILDNHNDDPTTCEEALEDVDMQEWKRTMEHEMESMSSNSVWTLVEALREVKRIGSKLITRKRALVNHVWMLISRVEKGNGP